MEPKHLIHFLYSLCERFNQTRNPVDSDGSDDAEVDIVDPNLIPILEQVYSRSFQLINDPNLKVVTLALVILSYKFRVMSAEEFTEGLILTLFQRAILPNDQTNPFQDDLLELRQQLDCLIVCCSRRAPAVVL